MPDDQHPSPSDSSPDGAELGLAAAAHEIRASLLAVKVALEAVLEGGRAVDRSRLLERSLAEVEGLAASVEDLLIWAAGGRPLRRTPTELVGLVRGVIDQGLLGGGSDRVVVHAAEAVWADVDEVRLRIAFVNLLRNALAYGIPDSTVEVAVDRADGAAQIAVRSRGAVHAMSASESILAPGVRRDPEGRNPEGRGLGLFIARRLVEAHGGSLRVESADRETSVVIRLEPAAS